ncbi:8-oxo-dGTP diphosphatase MutT [Deltaproteobacteria bacterium]|nr:8-oxo-dGTP diphosphatase MutT [Deltaproteobacteria bacterium]
MLPHKKPHIHVAAGLIKKDGRLLITRRPEGSHLAGKWEFPGGKQETHESLELCVERELKEELDIDVRAEKLLFTVQHEYETKLVTLHLFECTFLKGSPKAIEGQKIRWVAPGHLRKDTFPPPDRKIIESLFELL